MSNEEITTIKLKKTTKERIDKLRIYERETYDEILQKLRGKINGTEVALSIASGDGKEHMALISALINLPVG